MTFSERYGYRKPRDVIQLESMDSALRNALWSINSIYVFENYKRKQYVVDTFFKHLDMYYLKVPIDELEYTFQKINKFREIFMSCKWYEVYDLVEFIYNNYEFHSIRNDFKKSINNALEREKSAYRLIENEIARITDKNEIDEIELALEDSKGPVKKHIEQAFQFLASREAPDYRNSIKESISAIESLVKTVTGEEKVTLGVLTKKLEREEGMHPAFAKALDHLYGYTSNGDGIRHALMEEDKLKFEDAKFFLVACSAFVNYIQAKNIQPK